MNLRETLEKHIGKEVGFTTINESMSECIGKLTEVGSDYFIIADRSETIIPFSALARLDVKK